MSVAAHRAMRHNGQTGPLRCTMLWQVSAKAALAKYSPPRFLPFTAKMIFPASEITGVIEKKADLHSGRLSGSLSFFHLCDIDHFTVDPKRSFDHYEKQTLQTHHISGIVIHNRRSYHVATT
jgi:hypothetical protein